MTNNKDVKSKKFPSTPLFFILIVLVILALWMTNKKEEKPSKSFKSTAPVGGVEDNLENLGRTLLVGIKENTLKADGTTFVLPEDTGSFETLLENSDVQPFLNALEEEKIKHVLVNPGITKRNPIPRNTVRNRLALAKPAGKLSCVLMSKNLFLYRLKPEQLKISPKAKKILTSIARDAFNGGKGITPPNAPAIITKKGGWTLILTVRPMKSRHLSFHSVKRKTLAEAARTAGNKAKTYYERKNFKSRFGELAMSLPQALTVEMEVLYDEGTFIGPRDKTFVWRIIEPGIHGIRMNIDGKLHYLPPWYSVTSNLRLLTSLFERVVHRYAKKDKNFWLEESVPFDRFRTIHWREVYPGGPVQDLYRASPRIPSTKEVTHKSLVKSLKGLVDWIAYNQKKPNGKYVYRYFPIKDKENDEYNMVRHCLGPFSMALGQEFTPSPIYREKAEAGMRYIEENIRWGGKPRKGDGTIDEKITTWMGKPLPGPEIALLEHRDLEKSDSGVLHGDWAAKMGAVAVAILGYTHFKTAGWELGPEHQKVLDGLANFLMYMQDEDKGSFHHYYAAPQNSYYGTRNSIYPGEILYAVARLYGVTKDERYKTAFKKSMKANLEWFKNQMSMKLSDGTYEEAQRKNLVQFQPWMAMAMDEMYRYDPDPAYVEASNLVSLWILETYQFDETRSFFPDYMGGYMKVLDELPAMHTFVYTEGVAASFDLAKRSGADPEIIDKLRKGALLSARFILQQQTRPGENDYYYPNPGKSKGAVRYCMNHNKQRIDYEYHALSSVYRILKATDEEDYKSIHKIEMVKKW